MPRPVPQEYVQHFIDAGKLYDIDPNLLAAQAFKALAARQINIRAITTSEIKFSLLIDAAYTELAVRTLHSLYGLDK